MPETNPLNLLTDLVTGGELFASLEPLKARMARIPDELADCVPPELRDKIRAAVQKEIDQILADADDQLLRLIEEHSVGRLN